MGLAGSTTAILRGGDDEHGQREGKIGPLDIAAIDVIEIYVELEQFGFHGDPLSKQIEFGP
jgi:hypothetical protein